MSIKIVYYYFYIYLNLLQNISCYNPKRHSGSSNLKHLKGKSSEPVIPARYKVSIKTNCDPVVNQHLPNDYFPEVEYPSNIVESSKPFYLSPSPFPDDVKSSFQSLISERNGKAKSKIDYSWTHLENHNEKVKAKLPNLSQKVGENEVTVKTENEIDSSDRGINESFYKEPAATLNLKDDPAQYEIQYLDDMDKPFTNWSSAEQSTEYQEMEYVIGFINDMDEFLQNLTSTELPRLTEGSTVFESECSNEFTSTSDVTPNNNDSIIAFNGNSFPTEEQPELKRSLLFEESGTADAEASSIVISLLNEMITDTSFIDDMQSDYCSIGNFANETNHSCTED